MNELPGHVMRHFTPIIRALLDEDPNQRLSIVDLDRSEDLEYEAIFGILAE